MDRARRLGMVAAGTSAAQAGFELIWAVTSGARLPGYTFGATIVASVAFIALLAAAAVGLALRRSWGWGAGVFGGVASMTHGVMLLTVGNKLGAVYLVLGVAVLFLLGKSLPAYRTVAPAV
jgi:hypothetical protein